MISKDQDDKVELGSISWRLQCIAFSAQYFYRWIMRADDA